MRLLRLLPERWQKFLHEAFKFGVVGGINAVINYAVFNALALTVLRDGQLKATVIATIVATISSYIMNRHWTYGDRPKSALRRESALFFLFNATGLLIEVGVLAVAKYGLGLTSLLALNVAKTCGVLLATLFRFWSYRTFVFQPAPPAHAYAVPASGQGTTPSTPVGAATPTTGSITPSTPVGAATGSTTPSTPAAEPTERGEVPLEIEFADAINVELEAELATELNADLNPTDRRHAGR